jgi:RNA polymerase sigma factor (sigma-70 family)
MSVRSIEALQRYLRRLCDEAAPPDDAVLLQRFVAAEDREALALLIARHGPLVLGTARRFVGNAHDAEDVFQAVFLSLARLAKRIRRGGALPAWLHQATCRIAAKVRKDRGPGPGGPSPEPCENNDPSARLVWQEVRQALDEELQRLPERLRSPLVLCYLSGLTRDEAARQLGWSLGTLKRRLEEGRKTLRARLARRGIASVGLALTVLTPEAALSAVSTSLLDSTLRLLFSARAAVPATVAALVLSSATTTKGLVMKSMLALVAAVALGVGIYAGTGQADPPRQAEGKREEAKPAREEQGVQVDDPLPPGSTVRFGTFRFRHGFSIGVMAVSADAKMAVVGAGNAITRQDGPTRVFDLVSGRALVTLEGGVAEVIAISPDGRVVVTKEGTARRLTVCDSATGKVFRSIDLPGAQPLPEGDVLTFTPDGKALATTYEGKDIRLIDFESGKTTRTFAHDNPESSLSGGQPQVLAIAFSPDGKWMASGGYGNVKDDYFARLWDVETGKEVRRFMHGRKGYGVRSLAFSPDGKTLATLGTQGGAFLRLFDVATGKERRAFPKDGEYRTRPGSVAFAPDGKAVAVALNSIHLYDVATGEERLHIDRKAFDPRFTDGGKTLVAAVDGAIRRWDTATGKSLMAEAGDNAVEQVFVTPDGGRVVTRDQDGIGHLWDATSGKYLRRFSAAWQRGVALSPDGRFLACPVDDSSAPFDDPGNTMHGPYGSRVRLYDLAADKYLDPFAAFKGEAKDVAFTADGKKLVTTEASGGKVRVWDVETGKEERSFSILPDALKGKSYFVRGSYLSPGGRTAVATYEDDSGNKLGGARAVRRNPVRLWDVATGKELPEPSGGHPAAFSPDGRLVVTGGGHVCLVATGKRVAALPAGTSIMPAVFSPDGRFLATTVSGGGLQIWEVATWTRRNEFKGGHHDGLTTLTFAPGGQLLSGSRDTTVLAWDTRPPRVAESVSLESAWDALAAKEAGESFRSEGRFLSAPAEAVKYIAERVKPVEALDDGRVRRLLADLDGDDFAVREAASKGLDGLDEQVLPYLESTLKSTKSEEVRKRVGRILERRWGAAIPPERLRQVRAVGVLERIGDGESKDLLKKWAGGPAGALLTAEAAGAVKRLEAASKTKPKSSSRD